MKFGKPLATVLTFLFTSTAIAGAWGTGAFENDDALDWVWELETSSGPGVIAAALRPAAASDGYIEAPSGSYAIAAAEVLAAMRGQPSEELPPEVLEWAEAQNFEPSPALLEMARTALANVLDPGRSELAELWGDAEEDYARWRSDVASLSERLK